MIIEEIEKEVADAASQMTVEVVLLLIDKWEAQIQRDWEAGKLKIPDLLNHYVRLKISLHHVRKAWDRGWSSFSDEQFKTRINDLNYKVKEARRKYYVSKLRYDSTEHPRECSCRGCRCVGRGGWGDSKSIGEGSY
jgi:hypothetical protein